MSQKKYTYNSTLELVFILTLGALVSTIGLATASVGFSLAKLTKAQSEWYAPTQKQGTFDFTQVTPIPTQPPGTTPPPGVTPPPPPSDNPPPASKQYCVDEAPKTVLIESCDDPTRCDIAHGAGGPSGDCGQVIGWEHTIIEFLLVATGKYKDSYALSKDLSSPIQSNCYTAEPWSNYISTFNVIDSYNLAGFNEFNRGAHADATALESSWKSNLNYTTSPNANGLTPGDVVFFSNPPHVGIVNTVEIDARGNGEIWFLHTGATYYLGKLIVFNWVVVESSTGDSKVLFGSNRSKGPDSTVGETVCYCDGGRICYQWKF